MVVTYEKKYNVPCNLTVSEKKEQYFLHTNEQITNEQADKLRFNEDIWIRKDKDFKINNHEMSHTIINQVNSSKYRRVIIDESIVFESSDSKTEELYSFDDFFQKNHLMLAVINANYFEYDKDNDYMILKNSKIG